MTHGQSQSIGNIKSYKQRPVATNGNELWMARCCEMHVQQQHMRPELVNCHFYWLLDADRDEFTMRSTNAHSHTHARFDLANDLQTVDAPCGVCECSCWALACAGVVRPPAIVSCRLIFSYDIHSLRTIDMHFCIRCDVLNLSTSCATCTHIACVCVCLVADTAVGRYERPLQTTNLHFAFCIFCVT